MRKFLLSAAVLFAFATPAMAQNSESSGSSPRCGADRVMETWLRPATSEGKLLSTLPLEPAEFVCAGSNISDKTHPFHIMHMPGSYASAADAKQAFDAWRIAVVNGVQPKDIEAFLKLDSATRQAVATILSTNAGSGADIVFKTLEQVGVRPGGPPQASN